MRIRCREWIVPALVIALASCGPPASRLNAPPQGAADRHPDAKHYFDYMTDQSMMADRAIADMHFIPHMAELNGTGQARLERYAELLATRGGTLHYDTNMTDEKLIEARLETARQFLAQAVPGATKIDVVVGLPGSPGMEATEAIARRKDLLSKSGATTESQKSMIGFSGNQ